MTNNTDLSPNDNQERRNWRIGLGAITFLMCSALWTLSVFAQEEEDESDEAAEEVPMEELEEVVVTGTYLPKTPGEIAGQVIVLTDDDIRAMGEVTLERVLRQVPQNLNPTTERFGQRLNTASNLTGASTVNLRGLGSESTLILIDGKRAGYNGFLGGATDVSQIPLSQVERIEIVMDGASAIYGSDAVGGVVNVITRKDYEGIEAVLNYDRPSTEGYYETRSGITGRTTVAGNRLAGGVQVATHSGLDASDREVTLFQQSIFSGPRYDVRFCCGAGGVAFPILYRLDGDVLTLAEYAALDDASKARATTVTHAILPEGFNESSSVDDITEFEQPSWGAATQEGYTVLPETTRTAFHGSLGREITPDISMDIRIRGEQRETLTNRGYINFSGQTLNGRSPYNPFGRSIHLRGQRKDMPQPYIETKSDTLDFDLDFKGDLTDRWDWEVNVGNSFEDSKSERHNTLNQTTLRAGMNSDGVTPITQYLRGETPDSCADKGGTVFFGLCRVQVPPPPAVNPFGDISEFISDPLVASSNNNQFRFRGIVRGELFDLPGGKARGLIGASMETTSLESATQFQIGVVEQSPIGDVRDLDTQTERGNSAVFAEGSFPFVGESNAMPYLNSLHLSVSLRNDDYRAPEVTFIEDDGNRKVEDLPSAGQESTYGLGLVYEPSEFFRVKLNRQTAFVAPQLNQLLRDSVEGPNPAFRGLYLQQPDGSLRYVNIIVKEGGNPELLPETAVTDSFGIELAPTFAPSFVFRATYSEVSYENRIGFISAFTVDPNNLPSNTIYIAEDDQYIQERRWVNISSVDRTGIDYEIQWSGSNERGDYNVSLKRSVINTYDYVIDPKIKNDPLGDVISVVGTTTGSTPIGVVSKYSNSATATFTLWGVETSVDYSSRSKVTRAVSTIRSVYSAPALLDLTLSVPFTEDLPLPIPATIKGGRLSFIINNVGDEYGESRVYSADGFSLPQTFSDRSPLYGRTYNLALHLNL